MFPTLHSTIRDVLDSTILTKVPFILEPLAFPQLAICQQIHGPRFSEQLFYLTRTFALYMHKEYLKIIKLLQNPPLPLNIPMLDVTNPSSVSATAECQPALLPTCHLTNYQSADSPRCDAVLPSTVQPSVWVAQPPDYPWHCHTPAQLTSPEH